MKTFFTRLPWGVFGLCLVVGMGGETKATMEEPAIEPSSSDPPPRERMDVPPPAPETPLDLWMQRLHRHNPDEFRRFQQMRCRDPEGFRKELTGRLSRERLRCVMAAHPRLREFLESLPESDRMEVMTVLARALRPDRPFPPPPGEAGRPEMRSLHADIHRLTGAYRGSKDTAERAQLQRELHNKLGEMFDARDRIRAEHLRRIQAEAIQLQQMLEERRARKNEIIERWFRTLTTEEPVPWPGPI